MLTDYNTNNSNFNNQDIIKSKSHRNFQVSKFIK